MPPKDCDHCPAHSGIETQLAEHTRRLNDVDALMQKIFDKLDIIAGRLSGRPGWLATMIISGLAAAVSILATILWS